MRLTLRNRALIDPQTGATMPVAVEAERKVVAANRWRDQYNPLRGMTMAQAVNWLEQAQRGEFADFQWGMQIIERRDADLLALIERRMGMLQQMDWDIKTVERRWKQRGLTFDAALAAEQQAAVRGAYDRLTNIYEVIGHLALAAFRGYAHVQFLADGKPLRELNCVDQWNVLRDGLYGDWVWNPEGRSMRATALPKENRMDPAAYVLRTVPRPIDEIALVKYLRQNLSAKDWDGFLEVYGIPGWIVIMPQNVPAGKEDDYEAAAKSVAEGGSGALPFGSDAKCADQPRGISPFRDHLQYWSERLVLAGTEGLLTMLTAPGSGTLAGSAHWEAFQIVARSEARRISEAFQNSIDRYILATEFPGKPVLVYFDLAANEEQDVGEILDHAVKIVQAGGQPDWTQMSEKTGYKIVASQNPPVPGPQRGLAFNRRLLNAAPEAAANAEIAASGADRELAERERILDAWAAKFQAIDPERKLSEIEYMDAVEALLRAMPQELLTPDIVSRLAAPREAAMGAAVVNAVAAAIGKE